MCQEMTWNKQTKRGRERNRIGKIGNNKVMNAP